MWTLLLIPAAAVVAWYVGTHQKEVANAAAALKAAQPPTPGAKTDTVAKPATLPAVPGAGLGFPGTGTVDGHGTGVLLGSPVAGVPVPPGVPFDAQTAQDALAAKLAQQSQESLAKIAAAQNPAAGTLAAAQAAEIIKSQMIIALNTPEGARTPEQNAMLLALGDLPILAPIDG